MGVVGFLFDLFGRVRRRDFLLFMAALTGVYMLALQPVSPATGHTDAFGHGSESWLQYMLTNDLGFIVLIVVQIVTLSVIVKRLHDRDLSGFFALALLVPVLGWLWLAYELGVREGVEGANRFGPSPKSGYRTL